MAPRSILALALVLAPLAAAGPARADGERERAAAAFDEGVAHFQRAEYAEAARAFDEADRLKPSAFAITNALAAARRAGDHLLVVRLAQRAIVRGDAVAPAREAIAEASTHLCRLELVCETAPCAIALDGEPRAATPSGGVTFVLPGTHRVEARHGAGTAEEHLVCAPGATYRIALHPEAPPGDRAPPTPPPSRGLHPAVFFAGLGVTAVLAGVTVWSGMDAIASRHALPAAPTQAEEDDVRARARRTDWLLLGTGLAGVGTTLLGALGTAWHRAPAQDGRATASFAVVPGGALVGARGRF